MAARAVISLGTNTARLLVVADEPNGRVRELEHVAIGTRLGEGLAGQRGSLDEKAMARTLEVVSSYVERARGYGAALSSIATSAVRRADNSVAFASRMQTITGVPLRVLSGDEEAAASFIGATYEDGDPKRRTAVLDIGGGSTECAVGAGALERGVSCEVGSVRVTELFTDLAGDSSAEHARRAAASAHRYVAEKLEPLSTLDSIDELRAVAGTATTVAAIAQSSDVEHVSGTTLTHREIEGVLNRLLELPLEERKTLKGMLPQRADVLAAGAIIFIEAMRKLGCAEARIEANDLLLGYLVSS